MQNSVVGELSCCQVNNIARIKGRLEQFTKTIFAQKDDDNCITCGNAGEESEQERSKPKQYGTN